MENNLSLKEKIIGTWRLISWVYKNEQGETVDYFGKHPTGILMYDKSGYMNAQLTQSERPLFETQAMSDGTDAERVNAFQSYVAYYGTYVEESPGVIVHFVKGALFPNWIGSQQVRYGSVQDDRLVLRTPSMITKNGNLIFELTWQRLGEIESS